MPVSIISYFSFTRLYVHRCNHISTPVMVLVQEKYEILAHQVYTGIILFNFCKYFWILSAKNILIHWNDWAVASYAEPINLTEELTWRSNSSNFAISIIVSILNSLFFKSLQLFYHL